MYNTITNTATYTVVDIRKTFEGFSADFRMIATRTGKKTTSEVELFLNDIMIWAESKYLNYVDITLIDSSKKPIKASRYSIDENGRAIQSDRAGNNDWQNLPNTYLKVVIDFNIKWEKLTEDERTKFMRDNNFKCNWSNIDFDNSYNHLLKETAQLYANKGYELKKENFK